MINLVNGLLSEVATNISLKINFDDGGRYGSIS